MAHNNEHGKIRSAIDRLNPKRVTAIVAIGAAGLGLAGCGDKVSALTQPTEVPTATATAHPGTSETPTETKTVAPTATSTETHPGTRSYANVLKPSVPKSISYINAIPKLDKVNQALLNDIRYYEFANKPMNVQSDFSKAIAPDAIIQKWAEENGALPYTIPSADMTALQIANNFVSKQEFGMSKIGTPLPGGDATTKPTVDHDTVKKVIASEYYNPGVKTGNGYEDYLASVKVVDNVSFTQEPNAFNNTVLEVKEQNRLDFNPGNGSKSRPGIEMDIKGVSVDNNGVSQEYSQEYSFVDITGKGDWKVVTHMNLPEGQYSVAPGTPEVNPSNLFSNLPE